MTVAFWESAIVSLAAAGIALWLGFLTPPAAIAAALIGTILLLFGGWDWGLAVGGSFLVTSMLSRRRDRVEHRDTRSSNARRNLQQVLANSLVLVALAISYGTDSEEHLEIVAAFLGCVGAVAGDTWATAVARFSSAEPRLITSGKRVPAGTPGAVTGIGIIISGAAGIVASMFYFSMSGAFNFTLSFAATFGAVTGSLFDSYLGAACQAQYTGADGRLTDHPFSDDGSANNYVRGWRWFSNDIVNFSNSVAGAGSAYFVWLLFR